VIARLDALYWSRHGSRSEKTKAKPRDRTTWWCRVVQVHTYTDSALEAAEAKSLVIANTFTPQLATNRISQIWDDSAKYKHSDMLMAPFWALHAPVGFENIDTQEITSPARFRTLPLVLHRR